MKLSISCTTSVTGGSSSPKHACLHQHKQPTLARRTACKLRCGITRIMGFDDALHVPEGHIPVDVGLERKRFLMSTDLLTSPFIAELLDLSAQEYGPHQQGVLRIPCGVLEFEKSVEA